MSASSSIKSASRSSAFHAATARLTVSTFSCDIARAVSRSGLNSLLSISGENGRRPGTRAVLVPISAGIHGHPEASASTNRRALGLEDGLLEPKPDPRSALRATASHARGRWFETSRAHPARCLLRQPGGFEGFLRVQVGPDPYALPVSEVDHHGGGRLSLGPALPATHADVADRNHSVLK